MNTIHIREQVHLAVFTLCLWLSLCLTGCGGNSPTAPNYPPITPETTVDDLASVYMAEDEAVGLVIGIYDRGQRTIYKYGTISRSSTIQPDGDTVFAIGSITKVFTGTVLAAMVDEGVVELDDPVQNFLPQSVIMPTSNQSNQPMTLQHLATHTSGLPRNLGSDHLAYTETELYAFLSQHTLPWLPGSTFAYSNVGMGLLGHVLARQEGTDYEHLIRSRVCLPLGMRNTVITLSSPVQGHDDTGHPVAPWKLSEVGQGAGALYSTTEDMLTFIAANLGNAPASLAQAIGDTQQPRARNDQDGYTGLGWMMVSANGGGNVLWHDGGTPGFSSYLGILQDQQRGVIVLANSDSPVALSELGVHLLALLQSAENIR